MVVNVDNYLSQVEIYKIEKEQADKEFKEIRVWSSLRPTVVKEPSVLEIFSNGISGNLGNKNKIYIGGVSSASFGTYRHWCIIRMRVIQRVESRSR